MASAAETNAGEPDPPGHERVLARSLALNIAGRGAGMALGFISSVLLARLLGPSSRGLLAVMVSVSTVALAVASFGQASAVTYFASRREVDSGAVAGNALFQGFLLTAVLLPPAALLYPTLAAWFGHGAGGRTWILAAALVPVTFLDWTLSNQLLGQLRFGFYNVLKFATQLFYTGAVVVALEVLHWGVAGGLAALASASLVTVVAALRPITRGRPLHVENGLMRRMLAYGARTQVGVVFQLVNYRLDVIIMQAYRPLNEVGFYVAAQTIAELVITLATAFQSSLMPLVSHYEGDDRQRQVTIASLHHHAILAGLGLVVNAGFGSAVILFAYGPSFHPAVGPMLVLLPGIWFLGMGLVVQSDLGGRGRPGLGSALAGVAAVITVVLDVVLIPPLGVMGGALASVAAYTSFGVISIVALSRVSAIPLRELVVPTLADVRVYRTLAGRIVRTVRGRLRIGSRVTPDLFVALAGIIGALACWPLLRQPLLSFALLAVLVAAALAWRSVAIPLALGGIPPLVDAALGSNPLPKGGFTLLFSIWVVSAVALALMRRDRTMPTQGLRGVAVIGSLVLLGLFAFRLGSSPDQAYGSTKLQLFVADDLVFFFGAILAGSRLKDLRLFLWVLLALNAAGAILFLGNLVSGSAQAVVGGRFALSANEYPIELGRDSALGLLLAAFFVLASHGRARAIAAAVALPLAVALIAAGSRGPVLAFAIALATLLAISSTSRGARRRLTALVALLVVAGIVIPFLLPSSVIGRALGVIVGSASGLSSNGRSSLWAVSFATIDAHPLLGLGTGGFAALRTGVNYPHNIVLEMATELGLAGALAILAVLGGFLAALRTVWRRFSGERLLVAVVVALFVDGLVNACFSGAVQDNSSIWVFGGIAIGLASSPRRTLESDLEPRFAVA